MSATDIGIDLGTANVIITLGNKGIVVNEPSVVAYDKKKHCVLAVGNEAYKMIGRTPEYIVAVKPLKDGVISDNEMTEAMIIEFIRKVIGRIVKPRIILCVPSSVTVKYKILIGEKTAEQAKKEIANVYNPTGDVKITVKGRHLIKGLPESVEISDKDMYDFLHDSVMEIVDKIKEVFEQTPPELVGDILTNGIVLTGGGAMLKGFTDLVTEAVGAPCYVADDPIECVAKGVAKAFDYTDALLDGFEKISLYRYK